MPPAPITPAPPGPAHANAGQHGRWLSPAELIEQASHGEFALFQVMPGTDTDTTVTIKCARLDRTNNGGSGVIEAEIAGFAPYFPLLTLDRDAWMKAWITAACIAQGESGGYAGARNTNGPNSKAPGSIDRGLFQFNDHFWPKITDAMADNPRIAFLLAWRISKGWQDFAPWTGSHGLDPTSTASQIIIKEVENETGRAVGKGLFGIPDIRPVVDAVGNAIGDAIDWAKSLGKILAHLLQPDWWKRVGVGALGLLFVVGALILVLARSDAVKSVRKAF